MKRIFEPVVGCFSSVGVAGAKDIAEGINNPDVMVYFWIGVLGALGGLLVKLIWGCMKLWFPTLRKIDSKN